MIIDKGDVAVNSIIENTDSGDMKLLEIGCGDGRITSGLHGTFEKLVAIDPDRQSIQLALRKYPEIDFRVGSGEFLDFEDDSFDVVLFSLSLHHQDGVKALEEAERILAPEGKIFILEPSIDSQISQLCNIFENETDALVQAIENIASAGPAIRFTRKIHTKWVFQDKHELYAWLHDYYNQTPDPITLGQVNLFLKGVIEEKPLTISDTLVFTQLSQRPA